MQHVMHNGNVFMEAGVDLSEKMLFMQFVMHTLRRVSCSTHGRTLSEEC
jgi:hypothetical protein